MKTSPVLPNLIKYIWSKGLLEEFAGSMSQLHSLLHSVPGWKGNYGKLLFSLWGQNELHVISLCTDPSFNNLKTNRRTGVRKKTADFPQAGREDTMKSWAFTTHILSLCSHVSGPMPWTQLAAHSCCKLIYPLMIVGAAACNVREILLFRLCLKDT